MVAFAAEFDKNDLEELYLRHFNEGFLLEKEKHLQKREAPQQTNRLCKRKVKTVLTSGAIAYNTKQMNEREDLYTRQMIFLDHNFKETEGGEG